jgi:Flp pilus assembly protein TadG
MPATTIMLSKKRTQPGQALGEFAIVSTVFFMLIFGIVEACFAVYNYNMITSAATEAARYAIVHSPTSADPATTSQIQQVAVDAAPDLALSASDITVSWPTDPNLPSKQDAEIQISYPYTLKIPFISPKTLTFTSTSQMLVAQ